jgi:outer membrane protein
MTNLFKSALFATAVIAAPSAALAQAASTIIIVDMDRVGAESAAGKSGQTQLQAKLNSLQSRAKQLGDQFRKEEEDLIKARQGNTIAPAAFEARVKDIQTRQGSAQTEIDGRRNDFSRSQAFVRQQIFNAVGPVIQQLMRERNAQVVISRDATMAYVPALDVTGEVINRLNRSLPTVNVNAPAQAQPAQKK